MNRGIYSYVPWPRLCKNICGDSSSREGRLPVSCSEQRRESSGTERWRSYCVIRTGTWLRVRSYQLISKAEDHACRTSEVRAQQGSPDAATVLHRVPTTQGTGGTGWGQATRSPRLVGSGPVQIRAF